MLLVAKTLYGLEHVLSDEIKKIGGKGIEIRNRAISFEGSLELLYTANMMLRSATQILMPIKKFKINNADELYKKGIQVDWSKIFDINKTFSIKSTVNSIFFNHSNYPSLLLKDAIVDQFRKRTNRRPTVDSKFPDIKIDLHIENNFCTISLDSSGDLLYKRGYRKSVSIAPINEVLAAGIILLTKWNKETSFF
ncbi:THUMP domain-containing protein [Bacteroidota bacterium]|nr:THUMP domain-containing protein [Bacteroidota bacterium]